MPNELGDVAGLPRLLDALRADGFSEDEVRAIAWDNWRRVLARRAWGRAASRTPSVGVRTDPTDTGGLFVGRRPGTAPTRYGAPPERGGRARRRADALLAHLLLLLMIALNLLFWGPIPAAALWVASQVQYRTDSVSWGILLGFCFLLVVLFCGLAILKRLDRAWIVVRRAAGIDQRTRRARPRLRHDRRDRRDRLHRWLLLIGGLGPTLAPR